MSISHLNNLWIYKLNQVHGNCKFWYLTWFNIQFCMLIWLQLVNIDQNWVWFKLIQCVNSIVLLENNIEFNKDQIIDI